MGVHQLQKYQRDLERWRILFTSIVLVSSTKVTVKLDIFHIIVIIVDQKLYFLLCVYSEMTWW